MLVSFGSLQLSGRDKGLSFTLRIPGIFSPLTRSSSISCIVSWLLVSMCLEASLGSYAISGVSGVYEFSYCGIEDSINIMS